MRSAGWLAGWLSSGAGWKKKTGSYVLRCTVTVQAASGSEGPVVIEGESRAVYCGIACRYPVYPIDRPYPNGWLAGRPVRIVRLIDRGRRYLYVCSKLFRLSVVALSLPLSLSTYTPYLLLQAAVMCV